ncbi:MAG: helix-turn-helix transcriptional regulator [Mycoplasmataceae bacterium]|jgi:transcriptional regulator with XRE-family HTH domain|nr:helix-turn-helix transcriptional regulator [Mycoplasmataceae bacterium]
MKTCTKRRCCFVQYINNLSMSQKDTTNLVAKRIKEMRLEKKMSQLALSLQIGDHSYISKLETGTRIPNLKSLYKVVYIGLGSNFSEFFKNFK